MTAPATAVAGARPGAETLVMGIVNVTPDSFSDGGVWFERDRAVAHGRELVAAGAEFVDVGGESTRPGALRPDLDEELARTVPVVRELAATGAAVSIDTMRAPVARACVEAGASLVNDVSGGLADPDMAAVVADLDVDYVAMHWRGASVDMQSRARYDDVVEDVRRELGQRLEALVAAGVREERIALDPGLGFAKTAEHNWRLLAHLPRLASLGRPLLVGTSRKTFLGPVGVPEGGAPLPPDRRDAATAATSLWCGQEDVWCVRVHDVASTRAALAVERAVREAR